MGGLLMANMKSSTQSPRVTLRTLKLSTTVSFRHKARRTARGLLYVPSRGTVVLYATISVTLGCTMTFLPESHASMFSAVQ